MSQPLIMIAIGVVAFVLGRLSSWPATRKLRAEVASLGRWLVNDPLTRMFNREGLLAAHATIMESLAPQTIIVVLVDLDKFKEVNDTHGHDTGDATLIEVGARLTNLATRHGGAAARLAGDEFAALLPDKGTDLTHLAEDFLTGIGEPITLTVDGQPLTITITASIGVTRAHTSDAFETTSLRQADIAMYQAKRAGGRTSVVYEPGMAMPPGPPRRGPRLRDIRRSGGTWSP